MESREGGFEIGMKKGALEDITMRGNGSHVEDRKKGSRKRGEWNRGCETGTGKGLK